MAPAAAGRIIRPWRRQWLPISLCVPGRSKGRKTRAKHDALREWGALSIDAKKPFLIAARAGRVRIRGPSGKYEHLKTVRAQTDAVLHPMDLTTPPRKQWKRS